MVESWKILLNYLLKPHLIDVYSHNVDLLCKMFFQEYNADDIVYEQNIFYEGQGSQVQHQHKMDY